MRAIIFIIDTIASLVTLLLLLRFWLPLVGADFRNPMAAVTIVLLLVGAPLSVRFILISSFFELVKLSLLMFTFAIFIRIILSWVSPGTYNPATAIIANLTDPILRPFRRLIPPVGGFDISPIFAIILLGALSILVEDSRALFL